MLRLRRLLRLPTPIELGWSDHNALGMREFTPYQEGKTWEDWADHCKANYPVRYWLAETFPLWFKQRFVWPVTRVRDWVLDYTKSSRRCHVLDLRGIDPLSGYRHGYMDPCQVFWLAGWGSLMRWARESGEDKNPRKWMTAEQQAAPEHQCQLESYDEAMALVRYWTIDRVERDRREHQLYETLKAIDPTAENRELYEAASQGWLTYRHESEALETALWMRLAAIRPHLWD